MKFTLIKDLRQDKTMRPILSGLTLFTLFYLISDIFVKYSSFGLSPQSLKTTLFGNEEEFIDPLSQASFLEFWHMEIFFMMILLLTLSAVFIRLSQNSSHGLIVLNAVMVSAIASLLSLFLAYFVYEEFIYLYSLSFILWHLCAIYMALYALWSLRNDTRL